MNKVREKLSNGDYAFGLALKAIIFCTKLVLHGVAINYALLILVPIKAVTRRGTWKNKRKRLDCFNLMLPVFGC